MSIFKTHQFVHLLLESALGTEKSVKVGGKLLLTFSTQTLQSVGSIKIALARHFTVTPEEIALSLSCGRQVGYRKVLGSIPVVYTVSAKICVFSRNPVGRQRSTMQYCKNKA